jgi:excisionase family DNA binding protein
MMRGMSAGAAQPPPLPGGSVSPSSGPAGGAGAGATAVSQMPDLLTVPQVAQMLGVTEADVTASVEGGELKARKIGTQYRITRAALDAFLAG